MQKGDTFEIRKSKMPLLGTGWFYVVSHANIRIRGWALAEAVRVKKLPR